MRGGDAHGPDRIFDVTLAFDGDGTVRAMRMRALDDCGAYAGRAPLQLGKPVGAIRSEEHTSELQSLMRISYAVFCLKKKTKQPSTHTYTIVLQSHDSS